MWIDFSFSAVLLVVESVILNMINRLSIAAMTVVVPLTFHRVVVQSLIQRKSSSRIERIRVVGFAQAGNLIAATVILVLVSRL